MDYLKKIATIWNSLESDMARWDYIIHNTAMFIVIRDNDKTSVIFADDIIPDDMPDDEEPPELKPFDEYISGPGAYSLLKILGVESERA